MSRQYRKHRERYYTKGTGNEFTVAMEDVLAQYSKYVQEAVAKEYNKISKECVQRLKNTSPRNTGIYAESWHVKRRQTKKGVADFVVYNDWYMLTHLLENGYEMRNGKRSNAYPHIAPVANWAEETAVHNVKQRLENL